MSRKVLLISYAFPPMGESGVQRNLKYAKYLPSFGWKPYVLTVKDIVYHSLDTSLLAELPKDVEVIRTGSIDPFRILNIAIKLLKLARQTISRQLRSAGAAQAVIKRGSFLKSYRFIRNWFLFPDANFGWLPFAILAGVRRMRANDINVIMGSIGPYTNAIVAYLISRITGKPYILDFRDGWTDDPYLVCPTRLHRGAHQILERLVISKASAVCVYGEPLRQHFLSKYPNLNVQVLTNGYDQDDFVDVCPKEKDKLLRRIVFSGSVYEYHTEFFKSVIADMSSLPADILQTIEVQFVGRVEVANAQLLITEAGLRDRIKLIGYVSHREALSHLLSADALLFALPKSDVESYSGKIFEYIATRKPIISYINPNGIAASLLREIGSGDWIIQAERVGSLKNIIMELSGQGWPELPRNQVERFSRKSLTERFASVLHLVTGDINPS